MVKKHFKALASSNKGVATIEFALVFPLLFMVSFMTILFLFWIGDSMLQSYAGYRINQIQARRLPIPESSPLLDDLYLIPTLNRFQKVDYTQMEVVFNQELSIAVTEYSLKDPLLPTEWLRLALLPDWQNRDRFEELVGYSISLQEPYLSFGP